MPAPFASREPAPSFGMTEVAHRGVGGSFLVLAPPYVALSHPGIDDSEGPALGSAVCAGGASSSPVSALARLTLAVSAWPWIIPCVVLPATGTHLRGAIQIVSELRDRLAIATLHDLSHEVSAPEIARAVARRSQPTASTLARWVASRLGVRGAARVLRRQFAAALDQVPSTNVCSPSTYSRYFAALGSFAAHDWRGLARLCVDVPPHGDALPHTPASRRTTEAHLRRYLGMTYGEASGRMGWEWILEAALRRGGYITSKTGQTVSES